jgi:hypothetical protein
MHPPPCCLFVCVWNLFLFMFKKVFFKELFIFYFLFILKYFFIIFSNYFNILILITNFKKYNFKKILNKKQLLS